MPKRRYVPALVCYLLIPVVLVVGMRLSFLLQMAQRGVQLATLGLVYAFSEGLEVFFFVVLIYLTLPIFFNLVGRLFKPGMLRPPPTGANHGS